ncbi:maleylpyruvate isomerase family mycothiol-dependent enzyme [Dactylosporangium sp. NBC_01737]|uniref:maleylpyruvate isomerase family mycothiol-dependent enzyme n=1 Tax=Dactylosporangium sp. NBC_01737 TaxID=2975959 RepID=UPI002E0F9EE1|nr:maleylpyruvate isomerase family mycothiol-dependent enzyme [Dactylosporangium sp. NBC_01737]
MLRGLRGEDWRRATDCTAWDVRTVVSHLVAQCEDGISLPTLLRRELAGRRRHPQLSGVDAHMAVQVAEHLGDAGPDLVDRFATQWPRAVRARQRRPGVLRPVPIDLGIPGVPRAPLSYLLDVIYNRDLWMHRVDLTRATGQPFIVGAHDGHIVAQAIRDLASRWSGPPVALERTGDAGGSWIIGAGRPAAVVRADAVAYLRALAGRDDAVALTLVSGDEATLPHLRRARIPF